METAAEYLETSAQYREFAEECNRLAEKAKADGHRSLSGWACLIWINAPTAMVLLRL
jgi:hypothetical protein